MPNCSTVFGPKHPRRSKSSVFYQILQSLPSFPAPLQPLSYSPVSNLSIVVWVPTNPPPRRLDEALWPQCRDSRSPGVPMPRDGSNTLIFQPLGAKSGSSSPQRRASVSHPRGHPPLDGAELGKCWGWKTPRDHPRAFVRGGAPVAVGVTTCFLCALACQKRGAVRMRVGDA